MAQIKEKFENVDFNYRPTSIFKEWYWCTLTNTISLGI